MSTTNITVEHRRAFEALISGRYGNFCLFSCEANGHLSTNCTGLSFGV